MEGLGSGDELIRARYDRHLRLREIGLEGQEKLRNASVLLVGVGGLGSPIALYLAAAGVGRIGLIDPDTVSVSNLQRQVLYVESEVGLPKVDCARIRLQQLNSALKVDTYPVWFDAEMAEKILPDYDIVVDGCDNYATRYLINDACVKFGKPYVYGSIGEFHGQVSVFNYEGGFTYRDLYPDEDTLINRPRQTAGVMGVVPGVVGTLQAAEVIKLITGAGKPLRNRLLLIDLLTQETQVLSF